MKNLILFTFLFGYLPGSFANDAESAPQKYWSGDAHWSLIQKAFPNERSDCLYKMKEGSEWVDSLPNQIPSKSYLHAMRGSESESITTARQMMADFIQGNYEMALQLVKASTQATNASSSDPLAQYTNDGLLITDMNAYLKSCYNRGMALHPVMDTTSPAHAGFAIWSLTDLAAVFHHGDLPGSIENEQALFASPDVFTKTSGLMRLVDKMYLEFKLLDYRFEN